MEKLEDTAWGRRLKRFMDERWWVLPDGKDSGVTKCRTHNRLFNTLIEPCPECLKEAKSSGVRLQARSYKTMD